MANIVSHDPSVSKGACHNLPIRGCKTMPSLQMTIQMLVSGIALGFIYCLIAMEFTIVYNCSGLMNFGHERYIMLSAFVFAGTFVTRFDLNSFWAFICSVPAMALVAVFIAVFVFNRLYSAGGLFIMTATMALSMMVKEAVRIFYGPMPFTLTDFLQGTMRFGKVAIPKVYLYIIAAAIVVLILQYALLIYTRIGKAMRAVAQDKEAAGLMGINVRMILIAAVIMSLLICLVIGMLLIPLYGVSLAMTDVIGTKGFAAAVVGGIGNINGAIYGGLIVGLLEAVYQLFGNPVYKDAVSFMLIMVILMFKPQGLISKKRDIM